jgi:putative ABC transport system permease protein
MIRIPDQKVVQQDRKPFAGYMIVSPGFFKTVGAPLLRGREFIDSDTAKSPPVTIINEAMAKKYWPGEDPVGKQVGLGNPRIPAMIIVGVVADIKQISLRQQTGPEIYVPYTQNPWPSMLNMEIVVRSRLAPTSITGNVREILHNMDASLPVAKLTTLQKLINASLAQIRFSVYVMITFGVLTLLLASIGMYGVITYSTVQRTREIGIRLALGAERSHIFRLVIGYGVFLASIGIVTGLIVSLFMTRGMNNLLYGVAAWDFVTFAWVSLILLGIAFLACYAPARRATRIDPIISLKAE